VGTDRDEVERSIASGGLHVTQFLTLEAQRLYREVERRYAAREGARWLWEDLRLPGVSRSFNDDRAFERLSHLVAEVSDDLVFFPASDGDLVFAYRGTIGAIVLILGACPFMEYCIVPASLRWLLCENHHGVLIAVGEPVESRLRALEDASEHQ
jgi:hypothetical protein